MLLDSCGNVKKEIDVLDTGWQLHMYIDGYVKCLQLSLNTSIDGYIDGYVQF